MTMKPNPSQIPAPSVRHFLALCLVLFLVLSLLFWRSYSSSQMLFSNDCPLGLLTALSGKPFGALMGQWVDLNWVGAVGPTTLPNISQTLYALLGPTLWHEKEPILFANFYAPAALLLIGLCSWILFRKLKFHPLVCTIAALAATLNTDPFSNACWGLPSWAICHATVFLALAVLVTLPEGRVFLKLMLAGAATGMAVMEGFDSGAIYSVFIGAFVVFQGFCDTKEARRGLLQGGVRLVGLTVVAVLVAAHGVSILIETQIKGVAGMEQDQQTRQIRWVDATQWSLPKMETLRVIIPGLFGYRMDTPNGGAYWGAVGRREGWEENHIGGPRSSGSGEYAGVVVVLLGAWALAQSRRKKGSPFSERERKIIWFWAGAAVLALGFAWGRHAPFYGWLYSIPYFSVMRNPIKFMHPFQVAVGILFAFGLEGLGRVYGARSTTPLASLRTQMGTWWKTVVGFEKKWIWGLGAFVAVCLFGLLLFAASRSDVAGYMAATGINPETAQATIRFSLGEILMFLLLLAISAGLMVLVFCGVLGGARVRVAWILMGLLTVFDLARANVPWIVYYNYKYRYVSNPIIDQLRQEPYEHRVKMFPFAGNDALGLMQEIYGYEWLQQTFPYYRIQSVDVVQDPRMNRDNAVYRATFTSTNQARLLFLTTRLWELTNTRYLIGLSGDFINLVLNQQFDAGKNRFRLHTAFELVPKPNSPPQPGINDLTATVKADGHFALIEFAGALPRINLYSQWQVLTNGEAVLQRLADPAFDPQQTVLVSDALSAVPSPLSTNAGTVEYARYTRMNYTLKAKVETTSVLLVNDRYDENWKVQVDGQAQPLLHCNYLMRGVLLQPGQHAIEFQYQPRSTLLYVSVYSLGASLVAGIVLLLPLGPGRTTRST